MPVLPGNQRGTAAIEFAICAPLLFLLLTAIVEIGFAMQGKIEVLGATEAGVVYAAKNGWDPVGIAASVTNAGGSGRVAALPSPSRFCGCAGGVTGLQAVACTSTCSGGALPGRYIKVEASSPRRSILGSALPLPSTLTAQSTIREY